MYIKEKTGKKPQKRLIELFEQLPEAERKSLLDYAEFLASRCEPVAPPSMELNPIPRPDEESVVSAMKRLRNTYHMLDHAKMLNEASGLMSQHLLQGRPAPDIIDELEEMFMRYFEQLRGELDEE